MEIQREKAIFAGSRLYRQAAEGGGKLLRELDAHEAPFAPSIQAIYGGTSYIEITGAEETRQALDKAEAHLKVLAKSIDPYLGIPILLQATEEFYIELDEHREWIGTALKTAVAFLWRSVDGQVDATGRSLQSIAQFVGAAGVVEQLRTLALMYEAYGRSATVRLRSAGIFVPDDSFAVVLKDFAVSYRARGRLLRTLADAVNSLVFQPREALDAIVGILQGASPNEFKVFDNTIFGKIPKTASPEFWANLLARMHLASAVVSFRETVTESFFGITVFQTFAIKSRLGFGNDLEGRSVRALFWEKIWHEHRIREWPNNLLVERPALRVSPNLFVTSARLVLESIAWFLETSVMSYPNMGGVSLPDEVFQKNIATRFEQETREIFLRNAYEAGGVSDDQLWKTSAPAKLEHLGGEPLPGEIDVLAVGDFIWIVECKVLGFPFTVSRMRNLRDKLGLADSEGFHAKLRKKIEWLRGTRQFFSVPPDRFVGLIAVDRKNPAMRAGEHGVVDLEILELMLENLRNAKRS